MTKIVTITCDKCAKELLVQDVSHEVELVPGGFRVTEVMFGIHNYYLCSFECLKDWINGRKDEPPRTI